MNDKLKRNFFNRQTIETVTEERALRLVPATAQRAQFLAECGSRSERGAVLAAQSTDPGPPATPATAGFTPSPSLAGSESRAEILEWDRFGFVELISKGGQSLEVLKMRDSLAKRMVVAKIVSLDQIDSSRFLTEVEMLQRFRGVPQIIPFLGLAYPADRPNTIALITKLAEGGDLGEALKSKALAAAQLVGILFDVLLGLEALHSAGVIHGNVKPSNILLNKARDHSFLCDFGSSRLNVSVTLSVMITQAYAAEEALGGRAELASDMFSFGVILREAVTGCGPDMENPPWLAVRDFRFDVRDVSNSALASLILDCVRRDPAERPTVGMIIDRLRVIGSELLEKREATRRIRFREAEDPEICSFIASDSDTVGQALGKARLKGRLYSDGEIIPSRMLIDGLDPELIYVLQ